jgi:hypothetical protein
MAMCEDSKAVLVDLRGEDGQVDWQAVEGDRTATDAVAQADDEAAKAPGGCDDLQILQGLLVDDKLSASRPRGAGGKRFPCT